MNVQHHIAPASPYRATGPIHVREGVQETTGVINQVPARQRIRLLLVRACDADGIIGDAAVIAGAEPEAASRRMFARDDAAFPHAHNARRGCCACRMDRCCNGTT